MNTPIEDIHPEDAANTAMTERIQKAMTGEELTHYCMSLTDDEEIQAVIEAVNIGIDAHLTACNCPDRGDSYEHGDRSITAASDSVRWKAGEKLILATTIECKVSTESLPVLLRRLDESDNEEAWNLRCAILSTLGIEE